MTPRLTFLLLALFVAAAVIAALLAMQVHPPRFVALMRRHLHSTAQLPVRISFLLVILLVYLALKLSLDVLLGAFAAGVVVRLFIQGEDSEPIQSKLEAIGFGFLIPIFFIESGITFDLHALIHQPRVLLLVPAFTALFLVTRGIPTWAFFRGVMSKAEASALAVLSATGLPIIVVITTLGVEEHRMKPQNAGRVRRRGHVVGVDLPDDRTQPAEQGGQAGRRLLSAPGTTADHDGPGPCPDPRRCRRGPAGVASGVALALAGTRSHRSWVVGDQPARDCGASPSNRACSRPDLDDARTLLATIASAR